MKNDSEPVTDQELDAYFDGLLEPVERKALELRMRAHPETADQIQLNARIDESLTRLFPQEQPSNKQLEDLDRRSSLAPEPTPLSNPPAESPAAHELSPAAHELSPAAHELSPAGPDLATPLSADRRASKWILTGAMRVGIVGLAASLAWIVVVWQWGDWATEVPFFQPRPVRVVYREVVDNGFEPYYECRDDDRFAATFLRRQGQPLSLAALPPGSRMLGLSYSGGLSRDTTAMLCRVDDQPVIVFVDSLANDLAIAFQQDGSKIRVHRVARAGLVFYEVTPFDTARVIEYLVPESPDASRG